MKLKLVPCPLCGESKSFIEIKVPNTDVHIQQYGALYAGKKISEWKICGKCGFVHQNPRPSIEALNAFYQESNYHVESAKVDREEYLKFARWYYSEKIEYTS